VSAGVPAVLSAFMLCMVCLVLAGVSNDTHTWFLQASAPDMHIRQTHCDCMPHDDAIAQHDQFLKFFIATFVCLIALVRGNALAKTTELTAGDPHLFKADPSWKFNSTSTGKGSWVSYKQCDSRWAGQQLGTCGGTTICSAGCAMTSVAMMLKTKGANVDPSSLDSYLTNNGGYASGCDIIWAKADDFGVTKFQGIEYADESAICSGLNSMHGIIANVNGGGHWVLLTGCAGNGVFYVNDPGYSRTTYSMSEILREAVYH